MNTTNHTSPSGEDAAPLNGIRATLTHDEGAIARCSYCGRYSLDPKTLSDRQPKCDCGEKHGWSGSFKKPGQNAEWSGAAPSPQPSTNSGQRGNDALFGRVTEWVNAHCIPFEAQNELFRILAACPANGAIGEREAFDVALDALSEYQRNWDTGLPAEYASAERIAMECAVEAVREALNEARAALTAEKVAAQGEPFPYQKTFDAIAAATSVSAGHIAISVSKFVQAFAALQQPAQSTDDARAAVDFYAANPTAALVDFQKRFAPQQPAQSAEQDERAALTDVVNALRRIAKISYGATIEEARSVSKIQRDAADLIERLACTTEKVEKQEPLADALRNEIEALVDGWNGEGQQDGLSYMARVEQALHDYPAATQPAQPKIGRKS